MNSERKSGIFLQKIINPVKVYTFYRRKDVIATNESVVLSKMMTSINSLNTAIEKLRSEDFLEPLNRSIFLAAKQLYQKDHAVEADSVIDVLRKLDPSNLDIPYIYGISMHSAYLSDDISYYIEKIKETSKKNALVTLSVRIAQYCKEEKEFSLVHSEIISYLDDLLFDSKDSKIKTIKDVLLDDFREEGKNFMDHLKQKYEEYKLGFRSLSGIPSFMPKLDSMLDGFNYGHFIIIAARPGVGKSSFIIQIMKNLIEKNISTGFFSLEMTAPEIIIKIASNQLRIDFRKILKAELTPAEYQEVFQYFQNHATEKYLTNFYIDDQESPTIEQVCSRAKRMKDVNNIQILFIDYLTRIRGGKKFANRQEEIQHVSSCLCSLAKKLKIPIICVAQLNRESEANARVPRKSDLRESGQIEQDAHTIIMLHKANQTDSAGNTPEAKQEKNAYMYPGRTTAYIVKNRFGEEGLIHYETNLAHSYFQEINYAEDVKEAIDDKKNW